MGEGEVEEWLAWARSHGHMVKVVEGKVPQGVMPLGKVATLLDVKVQGKKYGPDDALYNSSAELRDRIARGNTVLRMEETRTGKTSLDMVIFALKKFTGGMGDEDEDQPEDNLVWQRYFLRPMEEVRKVVCVTKENGEAAHLAVRLVEGSFYYVCGSKNVHLMFRSLEELEQYTEQRYLVARTVGQAWLEQAKAMAPAKLSLLCNLLHTSKLTLVMEILLPEYQHVVSLSHLTSPALRFLTLTQQYGAGRSETRPSLTALPPDLCLELGQALGLQTAGHTVIPGERAEARMEEVRAGYGIEGEVLYFLDSENCTVGLVKKKTSWYVILRAIREKVFSATSQWRKEGKLEGPAESQHQAKLERRLGEIQKWLGLSQAVTSHWVRLGRGFLAWVLHRLRDQPEKKDQLCARGGFPQLWGLYLEETGQSDRGVVEAEVVEEQPRGPCSLSEPLTSSPVVRVDEAVMSLRPYIVTCVVRNLDLQGRNLKKLQGAVQKQRLRAAKDAGLPCAGLHDLAKLNKDLMFNVGSPAISHISCHQPNSIQELKKCGLLPKDTVVDSEEWCFLRDVDTVVSVPPLVTSSETRITEDTQDVFVEVTSCQSEGAAEQCLANLLKQIYHLGLSLTSPREKFLELERGTVVLADGSQHKYPRTFEPV